MESKMIKDLDKIFYSKNFLAGSFPKFIKEIRLKNLPYTNSQVKRYYDAQEVVQRFTPYTKVSNIESIGHHEAFYPFEKVFIDTMFFRKFGFMMITAVDLFTKYGFAVVYPFHKSKDEEYTSITSHQGNKAVEKINNEIKKMGYKIGMLVHDKGSEFKKLSEYLSSEDIKEKVTLTGDHRANSPIERFNLTMRILIEKLYEIYGKMNGSMMDIVIDAYNTNIHRTIKARPKDVIGNEKEIKRIREYFSELNKESKHTNISILPPDTKVRVLIKKEDNPLNKTSPNWSKTIYKVLRYKPFTQTYILSNDKEYKYNHVLPIGEVLEYETQEKKQLKTNENFSIYKSTRSEKPKEEQSTIYKSTRSRKNG